jgi:alpha-1,3-rhamnosyltransferase
MGSKPLLSVVLSSYNHENYVTKTIENIVNQTYGWENIELFVTDDCSKDSTGTIIKALSEKYNFHFTQNIQNKGLVINRNAMIKMAKGKYLCGCASDDYWALDRIEKQVAFMEAHPEYPMCFGRVYKVIGDKIEKDDFPQFRGGDIFEDIFLMKYHLPAPTYMFRREIFDKVGLYDESLRIEDLYMSLKISSRYPIGFIDDYLSYYRYHDSNISKNVKFIYDNQWKILQQYTDNPLYKKAVDRYYLRKLNLYANYDRKEALLLFFKNIRNFRKKQFLTAIRKFITGR